MFVCITLCCAEDTLSRLNEENLMVDIGGREFPNPCKNSNCPGGKECTIQYTPRLLKLPVAHCVKSTINHTSAEGMGVHF